MGIKAVGSSQVFNIGGFFKGYNSKSCMSAADMVSHLTA